MQILENVPLADHTAFGVGGPAEKLIVAKDSQTVLEAHQEGLIPLATWVLGYGTNCVVSDKGLPGTVLLMRDGGQPVQEGDVVIADAATEWDSLVEFAIGQNLWGLELMSGIPGNVGAGLMGNIAAYGQQLAHSFAWAEILDPHTSKVERLTTKDIEFSYRASSLQGREHVIVLRVALQLSPSQTRQLQYSSALKVANELGLKPDTLENCRKIVLETRRRAGSLYAENDPQQERTAGSFFKNPVVNREAAESIVRWDESGKTPQELLEQNHLHSGDQYRVSAAHVLLAAGFKRGQAWGPIRLHPQHVLKLENTGDGSAQQIYDVAQEIIKTVKDKLDIELEPEVRFLGAF